MSYRPRLAGNRRPADRAAARGQKTGSRMRTLFPVEAEPGRLPAIAGLAYFAEYITAADEARLAAAIDAMPWDTTWERRRQLYGGAYGAAAEPAGPIPEWGRRLGE